MVPENNNKETLLKLQRKGKFSKNNKAFCKTWPHITETNSILSTQNTLVPLKENLNCQLEGDVYMLKNAQTAKPCMLEKLEEIYISDLPLRNANNHLNLSLPQM